MVHVEHLKRITARFFKTEQNNEPVRNWLRALDRIDCKIIGLDIAKVELGWPIGMPVCRKISAEIYEVRSTIRNGKKEARIYFSIDGSEMLLLHGHEGKDTQGKEIALAKKRLADHKRSQKR